MRLCFGACESNEFTGQETHATKIIDALFLGYVSANDFQHGGDELD